MATQSHHNRWDRGVICIGHTKREWGSEPFHIIVSGEEELGIWQPLSRGWSQTEARNVACLCGFIALLFVCLR